MITKSSTDEPEFPPRIFVLNTAHPKSGEVRLELVPDDLDPRCLHAAAYVREDIAKKWKTE